MARGKTGLGRGLGALIPGPAPLRESVDVDLIVSNPYQPRFGIEAAALEELAESIRQHGVLQPLLVSRMDPEGGGAPTYQVIAGERRLEAARLAGLTQVPVVVKESTPREGLELALVENLMRQDLNPLEEAQAYRRLVDEFGLSQSELSSRVGRSRSAVANALRLLNLSDELRASLARNEISEGHARTILSLPESIRRQAWERVVQKGLSVRQTEELVRDWPLEGRKRRGRRQPARNVELEALEERLRVALGTRVSVVKGRRGGKITVHFYSDEELDGLLERLGVTER
ncbi:MAG: ParB/RepB/Spo0J family partition protein [Dehalococcoidia bacterium]|jgi:ParB family chromosome partitioning protein|nr:ParB/RepB/Spo0J family partition protein [Dehalococcoidia bacterium]